MCSTNCCAHREGKLKLPNPSTRTDLDFFISLGCKWFGKTYSWIQHQLIQQRPQEGKVVGLTHKCCMRSAYRCVHGDGKLKLPNPRTCTNFDFVNLCLHMVCCILQPMLRHTGPNIWILVGFVLKPQPMDACILKLAIHLA